MSVTTKTEDSEISTEPYTGRSEAWKSEDYQFFGVMTMIIPTWVHWDFMTARSPWSHVRVVQRRRRSLIPAQGWSDSDNLGTNNIKLF